MGRLLIGGAGLLLACAGLLLAAGWAMASRKPPMPDRLVGHLEITLPVPHRDVPLHLSVWYPAQPGGTPALIGHNALFIGTWAARGAPAAPGPHPLVVLSHGSGGNAARLGWFAAALAARGHVVAAPDHPGTTSGDSDPFRTPMVWDRSADLSAVIDHLLTAPPQGLVIDAARITAAGFSLGGHSALALGGARLSKARFIAYCAQAAGQLDCGWMQRAGVDFAAIDAARYEADLSDPRVARVLAIDPALTPAMTADSLRALDRPVTVLNLGAPGTLPLGLDAGAATAMMPQARHVALPGARHFTFLPVCSALGHLVIGLAAEDDICAEDGPRPRAALQDDILAALLDPA